MFKHPVATGIKIKNIPSFNIVRLRVRCSAECLIFFKYPGSASTEAKKADQVDPCKFGASRYTQNGFPAKIILNFKRAWQVRFLSNTQETQEICFFFGDVQI